MSQRRGGDDGPRQPGEGDLPEFPPEWGRIVVPDDPRELAAEAAQVRAELQAEASGVAAEPDPPRGWQRLIFTRRWHRYGLSGPLVALVLMLVASVASLMVVVLPNTPRRPERAPLASTTVASGELGGLLPDTRLPDDHGQSVAVRDIRPAVLLLMPANCGCDQVAADLIRISRDALVSVQLIGADRPPRLPANSPRLRIRSLVDTEGVLTRAVSGSPPPGPTASRPGPTAVLVRTNGVITRVVPNLRDAQRLRAELPALTIS